MIVYKVLVSNGTNLFSTGWAARLTYKIGETNVPVIPKSLLFCFAGLTDAVLFQSSYGHQIWQCEATEIKPITRLSPPDVEQIIEFWKNSKSHVFEGANALMEAPRGTYGAPSLKLIERIL